MEPQHVIVFLMFYFLVVSSAALLPFLAARNDSRPRGDVLFPAAIALIGLAIVVYVGGIVFEGRNVLIAVLQSLLGFQRTYVAATMLGVGMGLPWLLLTRANLREGTRRSTVLNRVAICASLFLSLSVGSLLGLRELISSYLPHPEVDGEADLAGGRTRPGFKLQRLARLETIPIRVAVDEQDRVFVSGHRGLAAQDGVVVQLVEDGETYTERVVARMLNRPYGLATFGDSVYVSRSGQFTRAIDGQLTHESTGAVTRLRDLDGDGVMDFYEDVVSGLPGSRGSDFLHQNSGITFAPDGTLFVTSAANSDQDPPLHEWEGTILRVSPDFETIDVFARGFRNPFALTLGPDGELFATDNDVNSDPGDELNHVIAGGHYGHPHVFAGADSTSGFQSPIYTSGIALAGLAYTEAEELPREYRDCLYAVGYGGGGTILRVELIREGGRYRVKVSPFATIPGAVDIAVSRSGVFYVSCYDTREIYRIRYAGE